MSAERIEAYRAALAHHDWHYQYSDHHSTYKEGSRQRSALYRMRDELDPDSAIWNQYAPAQYRRNERAA